MNYRLFISKLGYRTTVSGFHCCELGETDAFMTKLHSAEIQSFWFLS